MSVLIKHMAMPKGCIYANDKDQTDYCPMLNHDDVPFCQYIENEPEIAIGIDERPAYCPLSDVPDTNAGDLISRQAAIDAAEKLLVGVKGIEEQAITENNVNYICAEIAKLPSAQPMRKKGEWLPYKYAKPGHEYKFHVCSACGCCDEYVSDVPRPNGTIGRLESVRNFCPNCGAKMGGGDS